MRIVFFGTPEFSVPILQALIGSPHTLAAIFTQPDRPAGRGYAVKSSPVKTVAMNTDIPIFQPANSKDLIASLSLLSFDLGVLVAYGRIIPDEVIDRWPIINLHPSLVPKYRGASPIQSAIINGDDRTGNTIMMVGKELDAGDLIMQHATPIGEDETAGDIHDRLAEMGVHLVIKTLETIDLHGLATLRLSQRNMEATYCTKITNEMAQIDWIKSPLQIHNLIRGLNPIPGAYTVVDGKRVKVWRSKMRKDGSLEILEVQPEGKGRMGYGDYLRGGYPSIR